MLLRLMVGDQVLEINIEKTTAENRKIKTCAAYNLTYKAASAPKTLRVLFRIQTIDNDLLPVMRNVDMRDLGHKKNIRSMHSLNALFCVSHFCQQRRELYQHVRSVCVLAVT